MLNLIAFFYGFSNAQAECPSNIVIDQTLTCSNAIQGQVMQELDSFLGGSCAYERCYSCGEPYSHQAQRGPEAVHAFQCQVSGIAHLDIVNMPCDLDVYILNATCDPYDGCLKGTTAVYSESDFLRFQCNPGQHYYIVVEAHGLYHTDLASGACTDNGTEVGEPFSPTYSLQINVDDSTSCSEDCDDEIDNDLDAQVDCDDIDCWTDPICCDLDGDGFYDLECNGDDCDDGNPLIYPNAPEDGSLDNGEGDGVDNDCDGVVDNGTLDFDDDGDGLSEREGDCNDENPEVYLGASEANDSLIDFNCDGVVFDTNDTGSKAEPSGCGCSSQQGQSRAGPMVMVALFMMIAIPSRRRQL